MGLVAKSLILFCTSPGKLGCGEDLSGQRAWCNNSFTVPLLALSLSSSGNGPDSRLQTTLLSIGCHPLLGLSRGQAAHQPSLPSAYHPHGTPALSCYYSTCLRLALGWSTVSLPAIAKRGPTLTFSPCLPAICGTWTSLYLFIPTLYHFHALQMIP